MVDDGTERRVRAIVTGTVQGVGFRWSAAAEARRLGLVGWVSNRADGSVETDAQGVPDAVDAYLGWLRTGPPTASVTGVRTTDAAPTDDWTGFEIRH
jgi:acylphosphatase